MTRKNNRGIPQYEIDSLARAFIPEIMNFFNSKEGMREFEEWKAQRTTQLNNRIVKVPFETKESTVQTVRNVRRLMSGFRLSTECFIDFRKVVSNIMNLEQRYEGLAGIPQAARFYTFTLLFSILSI